MRYYLYRSEENLVLQYEEKPTKLNQTKDVADMFY